MRARRLLCILAVLAAAAMALPGCGKKKPGAKELITQAAESLSEASSMRFSVELDAAMEISQSGASMELTLGAELDGETVRRPAATHVKGTVSTSLMDLSVDMEQYTADYYKTCFGLELDSRTIEQILAGKGMRASNSPS